MVQLLMTNQSKYVPSTTIDCNTTILAPIPLRGNQLLEKRALNVQTTFKDGTNSSECLEGIHKLQIGMQKSIFILSVDHVQKYLSFTD